MTEMQEIDWWGAYSDSLKGRIVDEAFSHPAKMAWGLTVRIFQHLFDEGWLRKGELVADPFGGQGTTALVAASFGCPCIIVELEESFCKLAEDNFTLHREQWEKMGKPYPIVLQGDSRQFSRIVTEAAEAIITSPPFGQAETRDETPYSEGRVAEMMKRAYTQSKQGTSEGQIGAMKEGGLEEVISGIVTSPPWQESISDGLKDADREKYAEYARAGRSCGQDYGESPGQLGGMKEGSYEEVVQSIVTSPPYFPSGQEPSPDDSTASIKGRGYARNVYGDMSEGQIGGMGEGKLDEVADSIVTSPPYADAVAHPSLGSVNKDNWGKDGRGIAARRGKTGDYSDNPSNMGNLPEGSHVEVVDAVVTSPPWEKSAGSTDATFRAHGLAENAGQWEQHRTPESVARLTGNYGDTEGQIGQEKSETYWSSVAQVYSECLKVLRPGGVMCVVVKDFVRQKKRVPLCDQTLELLTAVGFEPLERIRAWVTSPATQKSLMPDIVPPYQKSKKSFFRRLAERRGSPPIDFEEVLVVKKPT